MKKEGANVKIMGAKLKVRKIPFYQFRGWKKSPL